MTTQVIVSTGLGVGQPVFGRRGTARDLQGWYHRTWFFALISEVIAACQTALTNGDHAWSMRRELREPAPPV